MSRAHIFFDTPEYALDSTIDEIAVIIGTSTDGPVNQPVRILNHTHLVNTFGTSTMENAYIGMLSRTNIDIYVMRLNGVCASVEIPYDTGQNFTITSTRAGDQYNNRLSVLVDVRSGIKYLTLRDSQYTNKLGNNEIISYSLTKYNTVSKLCEVINKDNLYNVHGFTALDRDMTISSTSNITVGTYALTGGYDYEYVTDANESSTLFTSYITGVSGTEANITLTFNHVLEPSTVSASLFTYGGSLTVESVAMGVTNNIVEITLSGNPTNGDKLYIADGITDIPPYVLEFNTTWNECRSMKKMLQNAYNDHLYNTKMKTLVLTGAYYGTSVDYSFDLANFCYQMNKVGYPVIGVLSAYPKGNQTLINYITQLEACRTKDDFIVSNEDIGAYICIAAGEATIVYNGSSRQMTLEGLLGGLLTSISNNTNPTNKLLSADASLVYDFNEFSIRSSNYLDRLTKQHFNCPYNSVGRGVCLYTATTMANTGFINVKYTRIGQEIVSRITFATSVEIGQPITSISSNNLNDIVKNVLDTMVNEGYMTDYDYSIEKINAYEVAINVSFWPIGDINILSVSIVV